MRFLIDGYNLLHHSGQADRSRSWTANRDRFLSWLGEAIPSHAIWKIVFDAQKMSRLKTVPIESDRVVVAKGQTADDWIDTYLRSQPPASWTVVSNDRQVRQSAKDARCDSWNCDQFLDWLQSPTVPEKPANDLAHVEKPEAMTALELKQLEELFGGRK